jgi:RHS repeat-associated protein
MYSFTSGSDSPDVTLDANKKVLSQTLSLPGGVLYTIMTPAAQTANVSGQTPTSNVVTWDVPNIHGDIIATLSDAGTQLGDLRAYDPFGTPLATDGTVSKDGIPDNSPGEADYGWLGQHLRLYEHTGVLSLVEMGGRIYSPLLGRFLQVDPVEGGSANDYDYVNGDPINAQDLEGTHIHRHHHHYHKHYTWHGSKNHKHLAKRFGVDPRRLGDAIHELKHQGAQNGKRKNSDLEIHYPSGDARVKGSDEILGNIYDEMEMSRRNGLNALRRANPEWIYRSSGSGAPSNNGNNVGATVVGGVAAGGIGLTLWWLGKLAAPLCGPAAPACAVAF